MKRNFLKTVFLFTVLLCVGLAASLQSFHYHQRQAETIYQTNCASCEFSNQFHKLTLIHHDAKIAQSSLITFIASPKSNQKVTALVVAFSARAPPYPS